jgi:phage-related tail protein
LQRYSEQLLNEIVFTESDVNDALEAVGATLNNHQRKWAVNFVVKGLGAKRTETLDEASQQLDEAEKTHERGKVIFEGQVKAHENMMHQSFGNPNRENHHFGQMMEATKAVDQLNDEFQEQIAEAQKARDKAGRLEQIERQMAKFAAEIQELKDDE